jgi:organic hydroperoxide reductase OsmC/OhrA
VAASTHRAHVVWEDGEDVRAHRLELGERMIQASSAEEFGGDPSKANPERLLVGALSTCHMLWFLALARKQRLRVSSYEDEAEGTLEGKRFTAAVLRPRVGWEDEAPDTETVADLHRRAHEACFIANSVSFPVEVEPG